MCVRREWKCSVGAVLFLPVTLRKIHGTLARDDSGFGHCGFAGNAKAASPHEREYRYRMTGSGAMLLYTSCTAANFLFSCSFLRLLLICKKITAMSLTAPVPVLHTAVTSIFTVIFFLSCYSLQISGSLKSCRQNPPLRLPLLQSPAVSASPKPD